MRSIIFLMDLISGVESDAIRGQKGDGLVVCLLCRFLTTMVFCSFPFRKKKERERERKVCFLVVRVYPVIRCSMCAALVCDAMTCAVGLRVYPPIWCWAGHEAFLCCLTLGVLTVLA